MRVVLLLFFFSVCMASCQNQDVKNSADEPKKFSIEGAKQEVIKTYEDGKVRVAVYTDEKTQKKVAEVEFHSNGQAKIDKRFLNDTLQGEAWCYYENGSPWSLNTFERGVSQGAYKTWHENGQLYIQGQYESGVKSGEWFTYFANGQLNTRGFYKNDNKVGIWNSYNLEGTMKREQDFGSGNP